MTPAVLPRVSLTADRAGDPTLRWNRSLSKAFDVAREQFPARSAEEALVAKYLAVEIKHLERREIRVPAVRMGAFLTAVDDVLSKWSTDDVRNLNYRGEETPPSYDVIQLNSTKSSDFLIDGMRFVRQAEPAEARATVRVEPAWYGLDVTVYGLREAGTAAQVLGSIAARSREINFLKGEAFSLSGEFLPKTEETWADLFLEQKNAAALDRVVTLINTKGAALENRGVILMGPPGTGKTLAARIVRNEAKSTFIWVSSRDFHYSGSFGGFSQAFTIARECAPSVIVFEDIDNWMYDTTVDLIKTEMDGVARSRGVVTMMTTNHPEQLPAALIDRPGRFHDVLKFDLPGDEARKAMLERWLPGLAPADLTRAVKALDGYSGAHVRELARFATIIAEQERLPLAKALTAALTKLAEQRDLITATQRTGSRYRMPAALAQKSGPAVVQRAWSLLTVKSVDTTQRIITGIATTPEPDRMGDVVVPTGVMYADSLPLLMHHDKERPVGRVAFSAPTSKGIAFTATLPFIDTPGVLKDRVDEAWASVKAGLITGVSIGFRVLDDAIELLKTGGLKFLKTEVMELSLVTIPANAAATILTVKSLDLAASGRPHTSGVTDFTNRRARKDAPAMTIPEQITQFSNLRAAKVARIGELMSKSAAEGATLDETEGQEFETLEAEVASIQKHLARLEKQKEFSIETATAITSTTSAATASDLRGGQTSTSPRITVTSQLPKGIGFTRSVMAIAACSGNRWEAAEYARQRWGTSTPEVAEYLKSAIAAGTTTDSTFAAPLAVTNPLSNEFIELLRPKTLLGRIPNLRRVPFNVSVPTQTAGGTYAWVGQGKQKPLTNMATATTTLLFNKIAGIIVLTMELVKLSSPSAEALVRDEMIAGIVKFMDEQFIDPTVAASGTVTPASITNGTTAVTSAGTSNDNARTDLKAVMASFVAANLSTGNSAWVMSEANKFAFEMAVNALGAPLFPGVSTGVLFGRPIVDTQSAGNVVALIDAQGILVADEGGVTIDVSRDASLQMDSAPTDPPDASSVFVNLFQANLIALRAERMVSYKRARTASVKYVSQAYV